MTCETATAAALFPGQGVSLAGSRAIVAETCPQPYAGCCELLGEDPFERAGESTRFAQPAIFLASVAGWMRLDGETPGALAGHSLGELSALTAAGALRLDDAVSLVVTRGALMADAAERERDGGMLAVLKGTLADARELCQSHGVDVANDNAPGQTVLSGGHAALDAASADARARGLRAMRLDVAGAFHSAAMQSACEPFRRALDAVEIAEPRIPVFSSMTAAPFRDVRGELARALVRPVRWRETMLALHAAGARRYLDVGPDRVLARLAERNLQDVEVRAAIDLQPLRELGGVGA
ncbi:MAG TPA: ACP S-malonyltransferase [Solirubrobacteraceae bacterium]|jgi:malonyl CoA-acyl carrier protein transacylase|nr:ACP S-malonyltransferase [Solirubrobacteraceae bacterium]